MKTTIESEDVMPRRSIDNLFKKDNVTVLEILIQKGTISVSQNLPFGRNLLTYAVVNNACKIARYLIEHRVDVEKPDLSGETAIELAEKLGRKEILSHLRARKDIVNHCQVTVEALLTWGLFNEIEPLDISDKIKVLEICLRGDVRLFEIEREHLKSIDLLHSVESLFALFSHPYPQNKPSGSPYVGCGEDGILKLNGVDYVISEPLGHGNGLAIEQKGLLGLTGRVSEVTKKIQIELSARHWSPDGCIDSVRTYDSFHNYQKINISKQDVINTFKKAIRKQLLELYPKVENFNLNQLKHFTMHEFKCFSELFETTDKLVKNELSLTRLSAESNLAVKLKRAVVLGNQVKAEEIIKFNPKLLLNTAAEVDDYSGKPIKNKTALQVAIIHHDVEMADMIKPYLLKLENGQDELEKQFNQVYPEGIAALVKKQLKEAFKFDNLAQAIAIASEEEIEQALAKNLDEKYPLNRKLNIFREMFDKISRNDEVFNPFHLLNAYRCFYYRFYDLRNWDKRDLFWRQIIGYSQRYFPACFAQAFTQGIKNIVKGDELERRSCLPIQYFSILPIDETDALRCGFDYAVSISPMPIFHALPIESCTKTLCVYEDYLWSKQQYWKVYLQGGPKLISNNRGVECRRDQNTEERSFMSAFWDHQFSNHESSDDDSNDDWASNNLCRLS